MQDADVLDGRGVTPLYWAYTNGNWSTIVALILARDADIKISIPCARSEDEPANAFRSTTRLYEACQIGRDGDVIELVHLGVNIEKVCLEICNTLLGSLETLQPLNPADLLAMSMFETSFRKRRSEQPEAFGRMHDIGIDGSLWRISCL